MIEGRWQTFRFPADHKLNLLKTFTFFVLIYLVISICYLPNLFAFHKMHTSGFCYNIWKMFTFTKIIECLEDINHYILNVPDN